MIELLGATISTLSLPNVDSTVASPVLGRGSVKQFSTMGGMNQARRSIRSSSRRSTKNFIESSPVSLTSGHPAVDEPRRGPGCADRL